MANSPQAEDPAAQKVQDRWTDGLKAARRPHRTYWLNRAYVLGQQWITWDNQSQRLNRIPAPRSRQRITVNRLAPAKRTQLGKLLRRGLEFEVTPEAADDVAVRGAKMGERLLAQLCREQTWESVRRDALDSVLTGGTSAVCVTWDTTVGQTVGQTDLGRTVKVGDVKLEALAPVELVLEPGGLDHHAGWWIRCTASSPGAIKDTYHLSWTPKADAGLSPWRWLLPADDTMDDGAPGASDGGRTLVFTMFARPRNNQPGRVCTTVNGRTVEDTPWPFPFTDTLNVRIFREVPIPGVWWGQSMMSAAVPLQFEYNSARSQILEHRRKCGVARLWVPDPAFDEADYDDEPGAAIPYSPVSGHAEWAAPPALPQWMVDQPAEIAVEMDDMLAVHAVSRGTPDAGVTSGVGLSILAERDDTPLGLTAADQADGWAGIATMSLQLWAKMRPDIGRRVVVDDAQGRPHTATVSGHDLGGQYDVSVPLESVLPRSRAAQQAWAMQLLQAGFFGAPGAEDLRRFAIAADLPGRDALLEGIAPDIDKAKRENEAMARGEPRVPAAFDNHGVHIPEHHDMMKSARFDDLNPQDQELFALHVQAHETMAAEQAGRQAAMTQAGAPDLASLVGSLPQKGGGGNVVAMRPPTLPPSGPGAPGSAAPELPSTPANTFGAQGAGTP